MIESIAIRNFKSIKELRLDLRPVNVLIGPNGAGKSNFVGFFSFIHAIYEKQLATYTAERGGAGRILYLGSKVSVELFGELNFNNVNRYVFKLQPNQEDRFIFIGEGDFYNKDKGDWYGGTGWHLNSYGTSHMESKLPEKQSPRQKFVQVFLESFRVYHFHDTSKNAPLKQTARIADTRFLRPDGANLAAFLYDLQQYHIRSFNQIEATVRLIAPYFERFDMQPKGEYIRLNWRQKGTDMYLDVSDLSDGTLRFIALCTLLLQPKTPTTLLIDEPELGLHPFAINVLADLVQSISEKSQVILSTQSVNLVNQFSPEDIIVVENRDNQSLFHRLDDAELGDWLQDYTLGDLWNKNVIGGNP